MTALLVVSGLSSVATGLAPVDVDARLHALAATPLFVCQPIALFLLSRLLRPPHRRTATLAGNGRVTATAAIGFIASGDTGAGAWERLALWPVIVALAGAGVALADGGRRHAASPDSAFLSEL